MPIGVPLIKIKEKKQACTLNIETLKRDNIMITEGETR